MSVQLIMPFDMTSGHVGSYQRHCSCTLQVSPLRKTQRNHLRTSCFNIQLCDISSRNIHKERVVLSISQLKTYKILNLGTVLAKSEAGRKIKSSSKNQKIKMNWTDETKNLG